MVWPERRYYTWPVDEPKAEPAERKAAGRLRDPAPCEGVTSACTRSRTLRWKIWKAERKAERPPYSPAPARGWIVHPVYVSDTLVTQVLEDMDRDPDASGFSDVGTRNLLYCFCVSMKPRRVLEIGTHIGFSSLVIGSALRLNKFGRLLTVEPHDRYREAARKYLQKASLDDLVDIFPGFSYEAACQKRLREEAPFEIIYLDAAHDYDSASHDIQLCSELVSENGLVIFHDTGVQSPSMDPSGRGGVRAALNQFTLSNPGFKTIYFEHPLWLNPCGAAIICPQRLDPPPLVATTSRR
jgi:predicted O-methyltransferase YrrM